MTKLEELKADYAAACDAAYDAYESVYYAKAAYQSELKKQG